MLLLQKTSQSWGPLQPTVNLSMLEPVGSPHRQQTRLALYVQLGSAPSCLLIGPLSFGTTIGPSSFGTLSDLLARSVDISADVECPSGLPDTLSTVQPVKTRLANSIERTIASVFFMLRRREERASIGTPLWVGFYRLSFYRLDCKPHTTIDTRPHNNCRRMEKKHQPPASSR